MVAVAEATHALAKKVKSKNPGLKFVVKTAMRATKNHWLVVDESSRFTAAIVAAISFVNEKDKKILKDEFEGLKRLSMGFEAAKLGLPIKDFIKIPNKTIGLLDLWKKVQEE